MMKSALFRSTAVLLAVAMGASTIAAAVDATLPSPHMTSAGVIYFGTQSSPIVVARPNGSDCAAGQYVSSISPTTGLPSCASGVTSGHGFGYLDGANTYGAKQTFVTPGSGGASVRLPHGSAPPSPADGDAWTTVAGVFFRINGVTVGPLASSVGTGRVLLNTLTASSSANLTDTTSISGSYTEYALECSNLLPTANSAGGVQLTVQQAGVFTSSGYSGATWYLAGGTPSAGASADTADMNMGASALAGTATGNGITFVVRFSNPASTGKTSFTGFVSGTTNTAATYAGTIGTYAPAGAITGLRIVMGGTTIASGVCKLYGLS